MRKLFVLLLIVHGLCLTAFSQYWQQEVNYSIDVSLNDKNHSLDGFERIEYINHSRDTLRYIWLHLWPNAYKNDKTAYSDQLLENGRTDFYFSDQDVKGYINRLDFKVNDITAATEDHPQHIDIIKLILPAVLAPGHKIIITTPFHVKLPYDFSGGGHDDESYQVTNWYPRPAVYDQAGWHEMPYLNQGGAYNEFGSFDVNITLPENYAVAATGELQNEEEKQWLKTRAHFKWSPALTKLKTKGGAIKTVEKKFPSSSAKMKTLHFRQDQAQDFAWFADKRFIVQQDTCLLPSGKIIFISSYYTAGNENWQESIDYAKAAIRFYSSAISEYPYNTFTITEDPKSFGQYPGMAVIAPTGSAGELETAIARGAGYCWFAGALASNNREHPWMNESMTEFYLTSYLPRSNRPKRVYQRQFFETFAREKLDQPIETQAEEFSEANYNATVQYKASQWLRYLQSQLDTGTFNAAMREYYKQWQFRHPQPRDFRNEIEKTSSRNLDSTFSYLYKKGILPNEQRKGTRLLFALQPERFGGNWYESHQQFNNLLLLGPAIGMNSYDKFMIGALLTNLKLPPTKLQFFVAPMWSTGAKKLVGTGFVHYSFYPGGMFRKINIGINASSFSDNEFKKDNGEKAYFGFQKLVPTIRFTLHQKDPRSTITSYIQWKTFFFNEESYRIKYDSIFNPPDTILKQVVNTLNEHRVLNQLKIVVENYRVLYPYSGELKLEQADDFIRAAFTGKYFFNYAKEGGLDVRFFAGKFFYTIPKTISKQFSTERYHLNLTGANGYEDYTYSDYFIGRNKFEGFASQQIMVRDGAFKVRTDLLGDKVGRSDDWLMAVNFSTSIPSEINPLSLLPVKIPLKIFVDIGTYAEAWQRETNEDRFLFDAGFHIPILKETANIYIPILYSKVFKDYKNSYLPKKGRFWKMVSFSIDISNFNPRKFHRHLSF